jgi:putative FmdB family regulatory protein
MPLYEYRCNDCGEAFEKVVRFLEADLTPDCPNCESTDTRKLISAAASFGKTASGNANSSGSSCGSGRRFT